MEQPTASQLVARKICSSWRECKDTALSPLRRTLEDHEHSAEFIAECVKSVGDVFNSTMEEVYQDHLKTVSAMFTEDEAKTLLAFWDTPAQKKCEEANKFVVSRLNPYLGYVNSKAEEVLRRMLEEGKW